mmetsp:Transcript_14878/g.41211  ORF Transcript_14878/g.41211 Transcript_14878/m.41211 type:complete len:97 (+) Transcript_14878:490-780(+)
MSIKTRDILPAHSSDRLILRSCPSDGTIDKCELMVASLHTNPSTSNHPCPHCAATPLWKRRNDWSHIITTHHPNEWKACIDEHTGTEAHARKPTMT